MVKEKPQVSAPAVASEPVGDMQYSVRTDNKFAGVEDGNEDPIELLEKLNLEAKAPKEKKAEKPAPKDKKKPASAPPKKAENTLAAAEKPVKKDEKPANAQKAEVKAGETKTGATDGGARGAPRGRGGRIGGALSGVADEQQPPASAPVQREPPPPPKYDQPGQQGTGAPRGRGRGYGGGFGGFGNFGGRGRGGPRTGGPRFGENVPSDANAAPGAQVPVGVEGGTSAVGGDDFVNRGFDTGGHRPGGYRGGRGGFRGRGGYRGRGFNRGLPGEFGAPPEPGGAPPPRKREFERHSGSDITGVRPVDKREGAGAHNWGTVQDDLAGQTALNETEIAEEGAPGAAPATGDQPAPAEGADAPKEGDGDKSAEDAAKEDEKKELTLEEYKAQLQQKLTPKTTFNVRSPEGADLKGLKQVVKKKEDQTEYVEDENVVEADSDAKKGVKTVKQPKAAQVKDVGFRYENPQQGDFGPRRGRGGRGFRGAGGAEAGGFRGEPRRGRFGGPGGAPPRLEDEDAFPALNPLGPH